LINIIADSDIPNLDEYLKITIDENLFNINFLNFKKINPKTIKACEVLLVRSTTKVDKSLLQGSNIKFVGSVTAGINHLDTNYLNANNIKWNYSPGCNSSSVAHYVLSVIAELIDKKEMNYSSKIGIIGYGNIGKKVAKYLHSIGFTVVCNDPFLKNINLVNFNKILDCDLISLHVPYTENGKHPTKNLINKDTLSRLDNKILINSSRGGVVNEEDLLKNSTIKYVADVWNNEPLPSKAIVKKSLIASPHIAGYSKQGKLNGSLAIASAVSKYIESKKKMNPFNFIDPSEKKFIEVLPTPSKILPYPLSVFKESFDIRSISNEMKKLFNQNIKDEALSDNFNKMRSLHPIRNDYDTKEFEEKYN
jgi:erythronate-4-phosphate dehydrogenase